MAGITDVGAVAGATQAVAQDAAPVINQAVAQSYEVAFKSRVARCEAVLAALVDKPGDAGAIAGVESLLDELCPDAGFVRTGGVQPCYSLALGDLAIFLEVLCREILDDEKAASNTAAAAAAALAK